jgi:NADPH-dependent 2,4-dienoyl-CoA reductase/sulfur reductase-like enzyme/rhodanese-related sulfurtransferase
VRPERVVIVGGVAGGASAAARARRLSEEAEIVVFERGPHVSFANCGLPYYIGGEIAGQEKLLVQTPEGLRARFNLDVRVMTEVIRIDRQAREVEARDLRTGKTYRQPYDALVLSTGAAPLRPPIPGIERPGLFTLRNIPDTLEIDAWIEKRRPQRAAVIGGGFIGLEMAEQLHRRGMAVTLVEALPQVMAALDPEMAALLHEELRANGVALRLCDGVASFDAPHPDEKAEASVVVLESGARLPADLIVLGIGVRPEAGLAREAGLEIGALGGIRVNARMQTSDPAIWAVGDAVEVRHAITGEWKMIPLAGPANRQGRVAADNIFGRDSRYEGALGTGILRLFGLTAAGTGASERMLRQAGIPYEAVHLHPNSHAGYFPGAEPIALKILFAPGDGRLLGAQAVGRAGVDKRIDVLATALKAGMTVRDLAQLELAYAPPFGSAKDPVNLAGMIGENILAGDVETAQWHEVDALDPDRTLLLDVRQPEELREGVLPGAIHIPLPQLRARLGELPQEKEIVVSCRSGQRSYYACRILSQRGFRCRNLSGAFLTWRAARGGS